MNIKTEVFKYKIKTEVFKYKCSAALNQKYMAVKKYYNLQTLYNHINFKPTLFLILTKEGFLRKNIVALSFFFKTVLYTHILNTYLSSMNIFSIYIYTCPVNIHCYFNCTDQFRPEI